jgi:hypothetical protein
VVGVDYHKGSPKRCLPLWRHRGVAAETQAASTNLKKPSEFRGLVDSHGGAVHAAYCVRYLNRPLLSLISSSSCVRVGGYFAISHFTCEADGTFPFAHPKRKEVLARGEVEALFAEASGWKVVHNEVARDSDFGRALLNFVAQRVR